MSHLSLNYCLKKYLLSSRVVLVPISQGGVGLLRTSEDLVEGNS